MSLLQGYIKSQFERLTASTEYKATIQINGGKSGKTNYMDVSEKQLEQIKQILLERES